jgi:cobalamin biosynthesis Co2+ chelatase CbiK
MRMNKYQEAFEDLCVIWDEEGMGKDHFSKQYPYLYNTIKELVDRESKYKKAFEILKDTITLSNRDEEYYLMGDFYDKITKEEYEILEELLND